MKKDLLRIHGLFQKGRFRYGTLLIMLFSISPLFGQNLTVTGRVTDQSGTLPGVSIMIKGTNSGDVTNDNGDYSIANVPPDAVLVFSFVGYTTQEIQVNNRAVINVQMVEDATILEEVVVVGYGSMERANVTGSIVTVDVGEFQKTPIPNPVEALRGRVSGLRVSRTSGQPGSGITFKIRGTNSLGAAAGNIDANNQPIIVIDGVPIVGGNLSELNPDDIESINILKDAAAASIYGSSGANGAVLITTKSGKKGGTVVNVNASSGLVNIANKINMMNGDEYVKYLFDSQIAVGNNSPSLNTILDANEVQNYVEGNDVDWQDVLLGTGVQNNLSVSTSGGADNYNFYINADLYQEDGIVTNSDYKRYSLRFNGEFSPKDWLTLGARVQLTRSDADETSNVISEFNLNGGFAPFIPISNNTPLGDVYEDDGSLTKFIRDDQFQINPLHRYKESIIDRIITRAYVNPYATIKLPAGIKYTLNTFAEDRSEFFGRFQSSNYNDAAPSEAQIQQTKTRNFLVDNIFSYGKTFGKHNLDATFVYGMQKFEYEQSNMIAENIPTDLLGYNAIGDAVDTDTRLDWNTDEWGKAYLVGRVGYSYDNRYNATVTLRRDGSSKFGDNYKYGYFPSVSFAWNLHNEQFLANSSKFSQLKARLSYGVLGNDNMPTYLYRAATQNIQINVGQDEDGNDILFNGYGVGADAANPNLKWEESKQLNFGVDFGLFDDRLSGSIDVYKTTTTDLLLFETIIPVNGGFSRYPSNIGETENKGIDINLRGNIIETPNFTWNAQVNWAKDQNKIVRLSRGDVDENGDPIDNPANGWFIGQDIREVFDYEYLGVWQQDEATEASAFGASPGDPKIADRNGDGVITDDDRTFLGNPTPNFYGGINNVFNYKGIELSVLVEFVDGVLRENNYYGGYNGRNNEIAINYWTPNNPTNDFPRVGSGNAMAGGLYTRSIKLQDASFIALRNISLGYSLPENLLQNVPLNTVTFYLQGNNIHYWTDFTDAFSPESSVGSYPITRTWVLGAKLTF